MEIIKGYNRLNQTESQITPNEIIQTKFNKKLKTADYFDYLYSYPPKIKIKWDVLDELKEDLFNNSNYGVLEHSLPFIDFIEDWFFTDTPKKAVSKDYKVSQYVDGFLDRVNSSHFFFKKTGPIKNELASVPIFVILNGQGEILLSKLSNSTGSKTLTNYVNQKLYDSSGAFDPFVEKKSELGLFFMNQLDAETYLKDVARSDFEGTQTVGLSINCINLESAYKITREYHPGIDFRFVPNFSEVKNLLVNDIGKSDMVVEDEQQQLRFRRRTVNLFPYLKKLGTYLSPSSSFLQRNEYFKGVPIYIVQIKSQPRNFGVEQYFNIAGILDVTYSKCVQFLDHTIGFGHNWIMQGSLQNAGNSDKFENYIFFEKDQAKKFSRKNGRKVSRYNGGRTPNYELLVRKPKILVYNLEDFLEDWEDNIQAEFSNNQDITETIFKCRANHFIPPSSNSEEIDNFLKDLKKDPIKDLGQALSIKYRVLKRTIGVFFSM